MLHLLRAQQSSLASGAIRAQYSIIPTSVDRPKKWTGVVVGERIGSSDLECQLPKSIGLRMQSKANF